MKIFGIGTDIVNIKRVEHSLKRYGFSFKNKIFSKKEISYCDKKKIPVLFMQKDLLLKRRLLKLWVPVLEKALV